ncbi:nucleolar and coiled-body phosphoprotein 1-like [Spea bombifrons]|uniref:nucleolar and coiled-body phosphoprotein 1-like n=1 Tax=Spea bombifrons TaxID=233779 RepID=UPI00234B8557|nr:nucleolar and coiled-body phosphoprotein 1-like [Spea bombifrons]
MGQFLVDVVTPPQPTLAKYKVSSKASKKPMSSTPLKVSSPIQKPANDSSESSSSDSKEMTGAKVMPPSQPTPAKSRASSKAAKQPVTPTPVKATKPIQMPADDSSESSDSDSEEETEAKKIAAPLLASATKISAAPTSLTGRQRKVAATTKTPVVALLADGGSDSSESSESDEELPTKIEVVLPASQGKASTPSAAKPSGTPLPLAGKRGKSTVLVKTPVSTILAADDGSDSSDSSDSDGELLNKSAPAAPVKVQSAKKAVGKKASAVKPGSTGVPAAPAKAPEAKSDTNSSDSSSEDEKTLTASLEAATPASVQPGKVAKGRGANTPKAAVTANPTANKGISQVSAIKSPVGASATAQNKSAGSPEDTSDSDLDNSQVLIQPPLATKASLPQSKQPKKLKNKEALAPSNKQKKSSKTKLPTATAPSQLPMFESEEETVLALLDGRSPKKNKGKKSGSKKTSDGSLAGASVAAGQYTSSLVSMGPGTEDKSGVEATVTASMSPLAVAPIPTLPVSEKTKTSKKRKVPTEDGVAKKKAKVDKKAKKEGKKEKKKSKLVEGEAGLLTPKTKSSKKSEKKSEKSDKKSKKKKKDSKDKKKEGKKKSLGTTAPVEGLPSPGLGLASKPKKKKKTKAEKM